MSVVNTRILGEAGSLVEFIEKPHAVWFDGRRCFGVSEVLNSCGIFETFAGEPGIAAQRGTAAHAAIAYALEGNLDEDSIANEIRGYFDAAMSVIDAIDPVIVAVEQPVAGEIIPGAMYGGVADIGCFVGNALEVWDWKCGKIGKKRYIAQTGAYASGFEWLAKNSTSDQYASDINEHLSGLGTFRTRIIELKPNGKFRVEVYDAEECIALWNEGLSKFTERIGLS